MNELTETLKTASIETLWAILADLSQLMELREYKPDKNNKPFMIWYGFYKDVEGEINRRMIRDFMEG